MTVKELIAKLEEYGDHNEVTLYDYDADYEYGLHEGSVVFQHNRVMIEFDGSNEKEDE
jgi:hypothetical protein